MINNNIVLASASPRRVELLKKLGINFKVEISCFDESKITVSNPFKYALEAASGKANEVFLRLTSKVNDELLNLTGKDLQKDYVVIGADTVVYSKGKILGKPKNKNQAKEMLVGLSNSVHSVITGVCIKTREKSVEFYDETKVTFGDLGAIASEYIALGLPFDKAGGYGIQDKLIYDKLISLQGSLDNVVGLPTEKLLPYFCG